MDYSGFRKSVVLLNLTGWVTSWPAPYRKSVWMTFRTVIQRQGSRGTSESESETCVRQNHTFACKRERCRLMRPQSATTEESHWTCRTIDLWIATFVISQTVQSFAITNIIYQSYSNYILKYFLANRENPCQHGKSHTFRWCKMIFIW